MDNLLKVEGHRNLYRDPKSKAIIVNDDEKRQNYLNQRKLAEESRQNYDYINTDIANIKKDVEVLHNQLDIIIQLLSKK